MSVTQKVRTSRKVLSVEESIWEGDEGRQAPHLRTDEAPPDFPPKASQEDHGGDPAPQADHDGPYLLNLAGQEPQAGQLEAFHQSDLRLLDYPLSSRHPFPPADFPPKAVSISPQHVELVLNTIIALQDQGSLMELVEITKLQRSTVRVAVSRLMEADKIVRLPREKNGLPCRYCVPELKHDGIGAR